MDLGKKHAALLRRKAKTRAQRNQHLLSARLYDVEKLIQQRELPLAYKQLKELDSKHPQNKDILFLLATVCRDTYVPEYRDVCLRLVELDASDREALLMLADGHLRNDHATLALVAFQQFLEQWPDDPRATGVRRSVTTLAADVDEKGTNANIPSSDRLEILTIHEELQISMSRQEFERVIEQADQIISRYPNFAPAGNNRAEALFHLGRLDEAITECRRVQRYDVENGFTLATLARYLFLQGNREEAEACAAKLKSAATINLQWSVKTAETLSMLSDDDGVLEVFEQAKPEVKRMKAPCLDAALLCHYAAAVHLRRGDESQARRMWRKSLSFFPNLEHARDNLEDLDRPVRERHTPWAVSFQSFLPIFVYVELDELIKSKGDTTEGLKVLKHQLLQRCPYLRDLIPLLLQRGDPRARTIAWWIASTSMDDPKMLDALHCFATSQAGPDDMRHKTLFMLSRENALADRCIRMWRDGQCRDELVFSWEICSDKVTDRGWSDEVEQLSERAIQSLQDGQAELAESLLEKALQKQPETPELLNNLAAAYSQQGRYAEADSLIGRIHQDYPDYLEGCTNFAVQLVHQGEIQRAKEIVDPLMKRRRFHFSEFSALCFSKVSIAKAEGKFDVFQSWVDHWDRMLPDDPKLEIVRGWQREHARRTGSAG